MIDVEEVRRTMPERKVALRCPNCNRAMTGATFYQHATEVYDRTCPKCRKRWRVIVKPVGTLSNGGFAHDLTWYEKTSA